MSVEYIKEVKQDHPPIIKIENDTDKKYTLVIRGEVAVNSNNLEFLEGGLFTVPPTRSTYIQYNESGIVQRNEKVA